MTDVKEWQQERARSEPSNLEIMGAYAPSEHLRLYEVGNTARETRYILASSRKNANIIAMMGGHIRELKNATHWKPVHSADHGTALAQAISYGMPGVIFFRPGCVIARDNVFCDRKPTSRGSK